MPTVDGVHFPYTKQGIAKAKAWAEMTGKPMKTKSGEENYPKLFTKKDKNKKPFWSDKPRKKKKKDVVMQTSTEGMEVRGETYAKGGRIPKYQEGGDTLRTHISVPRYSGDEEVGSDKLLLGSELHKEWLDTPKGEWAGYGGFTPREGYDVGLVEGMPYYMGKESGKAVMWDPALQGAFDRGELDISTTESKEKMKKLLSGKSKYKNIQEEVERKSKKAGTSTYIPELRGGGSLWDAVIPQYKKGGKVKMPKGWHV